MSALIASFLGPILPYIVAGFAAFITAGGFILNEKRKSKNQGIAQQQAKEAAANAKDIDVIQRATGARPVGGVQSDPNNRDNAKG